MKRCWPFYIRFFYRWESAQQRPANTIPAVGSPAELREYPDIRPMLPPFLQGAKCPKFWPKIRPQSSSDRHIFELGHFIGKQKQTCQGPMIGLSPYQTWGGWVPQLPEPLAQWVPQKVENFLFILHSSGPCRVQRHQCYSTCWGRSCCKKTPLNCNWQNAISITHKV